MKWKNQGFSKPLKMGEKISSKGFTLLEIVFVIAILSILAAIATFHLAGYRKDAQDTVTKENLRQAYTAAQVYFANNPKGSAVDLSSLRSYGFAQSEKVGLTMERNGYADLLMTASYLAPRSQTFAVDWRGNIFPVHASSSPTNTGGSGSSPEGGGKDGNPSGGNGGAQDGESPQGPVDLGDPAQMMKSTLTQARAAAIDFFRTNPNGVLTLPILNEHGVTPDGSISLIVENGTPEGLSITVSSHVPEMQSYTIDARGIITP